MGRGHPSYKKKNGKKKKKKNIPSKMFLYAESPEQERNTLSHLTESIGLVFPNCLATFCSEDQFGVAMGGGRLHKKLCWGDVEAREVDKEGVVSWAGGQSLIENDQTFFFVCFRGGGGWCCRMKRKGSQERERGTRTKEEEWLGGQRRRERDYYSGLTAPSVGTVKLLIQTEYGRGQFKGYICTGIASD